MVKLYPEPFRDEYPHVTILTNADAQTGNNGFIHDFENIRNLIMARNQPSLVHFITLLSTNYET